ncbi:MAG: CopG family transcriptional regulator [Steroidobacteraceae bacterium]
MRTTLDIDEPVLEALKELSRRQGRTAGAVASELIHRALSQPSAQAADAAAVGRHGFRPFGGAPSGAADLPGLAAPPSAAASPDAALSTPRATNEQVNRLRDESGI